MNNFANQSTSKPFPWKCDECRQRDVYPDRFAYQCEIAYDGRTYPIEVPELETPRCRNCGAIVVTEAANDQISEAFRLKLGLLSPDEIRRRRKDLKLSQAKLAELLGIAETTLCRWETGAQIQQRSLNHLLDVFFTFPQVRSYLEKEKSDIQV